MILDLSDYYFEPRGASRREREVKRRTKQRERTHAKRLAPGRAAHVEAKLRYDEYRRLR